jgi:putative transposase
MKPSVVSQPWESPTSRARSLVMAPASTVSTQTRSSARAHLTGKDDGVVVTAPILARVPDFAGLLKAAEDEAATRALLNSRTTGRPVGAADWIEGLEAQTGRERAAGRRGAKPGAKSPDASSDDLFHTLSP